MAEIGITLSHAGVSRRADADRRVEFDSLVRRHHRKAFQVAFRMTGSAADAEDLTQETFLRAFRFFGKYRPELPFERWLYKIMSNVFVDGLRSRPRAEIRSLDQPLQRSDGADTVYREIADAAADPERALLADVLEEDIQRALLSLPPYYRLTVILADIQGLSYKEISAVMACPVGAVRSRLHRGRSRLRERLMPSLVAQATVRPFTG